MQVLEVREGMTTEGAFEMDLKSSIEFNWD